MYGGKFAFQNRLGYLIVERKLPFLLCFTLYLMAIFQGQDPGGLILGGAISRRVFYVRSLGVLIHGGAYFRNFYGSFSMGFKYGCIPAVSKAHLLEF